MTDVGPALPASATTGPPALSGVARSWWRSLHARLVMAMSLVVALGTTMLGIDTVASESGRLRLDLQQRAQAMARSMALAIVNPMLTQQFDEVEQVLERHAPFPDVLGLVVLDAHRQVISEVGRGADGRVKLLFGAARSQPQPPSQLAAQTPPQAASSAAAGATQRAAGPPLPPLPLPKLTPTPEGDGSSGGTASHDGAHEIVAWHPVAEGRPIGWVSVRLGTDRVDQLRRQVVWRATAVGLGAALFCATVLGWLLRSPMRSLEAARRHALTLRHGDSPPMPVPARGPRETVELAQALNDTAHRLALQGQAIDHALGQLRQRSEELDQRNHLLDAVLALSPNGLVALGSDDQVLFANAAFTRLTGLPAAGLVGLSLQTLERLLRERASQPELWAGLEPCFEPAPVHTAHLLQMARPRGLELQLVGRKGDGAGIGRLLAVQDVTHEREVERLKSEFLSTAAHELRTPMVSIQGFAELLRMRDFPPQRRNELLDHVLRNAQRLTRIVDDLLDLSQIDARRGIDFEWQCDDLAALAREVVHDFAPPSPEQSVQLLCDPGAEQLPVWVDHAKMAQVLNNLLSNACKYSVGGAPVQVRLLAPTGTDVADAAPVAGFQPPPCSAGFAVIDRGIGMTPEQLERVFERFYRADPSGTVLGTGLGMSIAKDIIDLHGGKISLLSAPGEGTTVIVWLPLATTSLGATQPSALELLAT